ncbi:23263_t:CDS:2 [Gigaspora margarita]|uniref:23263_t:CDS:1 n=1 Tax=Gigaspora margarita TaxID=4874 RepID=A0ABN7V9X0_GIGMA|nr:23263_t:CDS:2 [Gigaspora margarita]
MLQNNKQKFKIPKTSSQSILEKESSSSSLISSESILYSNIQNKTTSGERNQSPIWNFFIKNKPHNLDIFQQNCPNIDNEIWQLYLLCMAYCNNLKEQSESITGSKKQKLNN